MKLNKKGFTLVELLAVIVVLALLMVVAASSIGSALGNAKKNTLKTEAQKVITGVYQEAQSAYMLSPGNLTNNIKATAGTTSGIQSVTRITSSKCYAYTSASRPLATAAACPSSVGLLLTANSTSPLYEIKGQDGDYTYEVIVNASGNIQAYVVNYGTELSIYIKTASTGAPKVPDEVTILETTSSLKF